MRLNSFWFWPPKFNMRLEDFKVWWIKQLITGGMKNKRINFIKKFDKFDEKFAVIHNLFLSHHQNFESHHNSSKFFQKWLNKPWICSWSKTFLTYKSFRAHSLSSPETPLEILPAVLLKFQVFDLCSPKTPSRQVFLSLYSRYRCFVFKYDSVIPRISASSL